MRSDSEDRQGQAGRQDRAGPAGQETAWSDGGCGSDLLRRRVGTVEGRGVGAHGTRLSERDRPHDPATWSLDVGPTRQKNDGRRAGVMYWEIGDSLGRGGHRLTDAPERGLESAPCWLDEEPYHGD